MKFLSLCSLILFSQYSMATWYCTGTCNYQWSDGRSYSTVAQGRGSSEGEAISNVHRSCASSCSSSSNTKCQASEIGCTVRVLNSFSGAESVNNP